MQAMATGNELTSTVRIEPKIDTEKLELLEKSKQEFARRRKVLLSNIPDGIDLEELKNTILQGLGALEVKLENKSVHILFKNVKEAEQGVETLKSLNSDFADKGITISFPEPDSLLFVGNLPFEVNEDQLGELMSQYGKLERVFLVRSEVTGESKGYGFAEYADKKTAGEAKQQLLKSGAKYISGRILRVDFAEPNLHAYKDLHSKTLFLDKLPRDFIDGEVLRKMFSQSGKVTYAQVAISTQAGTSRGFAFVDYETGEEAERGQIAHNNAKIGDCNIRTSYGTPGRSGASVLGPCTPNQKTKPVSLMSATVPNAMIRPPPARPPMNPRPLMSGPMICPDPSVHMIRGGPMPLMAAGPQFWDPRAGFYPRPAAPGMYPGGGPRPPMGNPRGPNPLMGGDIRGPRPMGPRGPVPGGMPSPQGTSGPVRPLMDPKHDGVGSDQTGVLNPPNSSSQGLASNNINNQRTPQPLMQSMSSNQQATNTSQGQQSLFQSQYNNNNMQPSLLGQQPTTPLSNTGMSGNGTGFTGPAAGNGPRPRGPTPLMSSDTWGGQQSTTYPNSTQQYPSQAAQAYPAQNTMSYQSTAQASNYQSAYQDTAYNSTHVQSQYNQPTSTDTWQQQPQPGQQSQQEWQSMYSQQQQYNAPSQAATSNNQSYSTPLQPHHASAPFNYTGNQATKTTDQAKSTTPYQTSGDMYDIYYNVNKRPRY